MSDSSPISEELRARVSDFTDQKIINVIKQANLFPEDVVKGAKVIAEERGLDMNAMMESLANVETARKSIRAALAKNKKVKLRLLDISEKFNISTEEADRVVKQEIERLNNQEDSSSNGIGIGTALFIIFIIIKWIIRANQ